MLRDQIFWGALLITGCVIFHVLALLLLSKTLKSLDLFCHKVFKLIGTVKNLVLMVYAIMYVIAVHTIEIIFWALTYIKIGEFNNLYQAVYFSTVTATTLGYGDIVLSDKAQLLSGFEAIGGLILFSVSTAFFISLIAIFFEPVQKLD